MAETKLINTISLDNNLLVSFYDESRKIAGDRWQVILKAIIIIETNQIQFTHVDSKKRFEIIQVIGENIQYEKKLIRNFIAENEKEEVFNLLFESFMQNTRPYLSHHQFAERFVLKTYADSLEKRKWVKN